MKSNALVMLLLVDIKVLYIIFYNNKRRCFTGGICKHLPWLAVNWHLKGLWLEGVNWGGCICLYISYWNAYKTGSGIQMCTNKNLTVKCASGQNSGNFFFDTSNPVWCLYTTLCSLIGTKVCSFIIRACKPTWASVSV